MFPDLPPLMHILRLGQEQHSIPDDSLIKLEATLNFVQCTASFQLQVRRCPAWSAIIAFECLVTFWSNYCPYVNETSKLLNIVKYLSCISNLTIYKRPVNNLINRVGSKQGICSTNDVFHSK